MCMCVCVCICKEVHTHTRVNYNNERALMGLQRDSNHKKVKTLKKKSKRRSTKISPSFAS